MEVEYQLYVCSCEILGKLLNLSAYFIIYCNRLSRELKKTA